MLTSRSNPTSSTSLPLVPKNGIISHRNDSSEDSKQCECCRNSKQMVEQLKTQLGGKESELVEMRKQLFEQVQINERQMAVQKEQVGSNIF